MFKRLARQGLHNRLVTSGVNPAVAYELANVVYPGNDPTVSRPPIVSASEAAGIVEGFLDLGTISEKEMIQAIWGVTNETPELS